ncbi:site-specific DNA-methyltransferase (plasmid) [Rossellomorea sp. AcN35-11]|nr:site-specific DNA-methyltransferase [Rossellomorea aquimaris]WJV31849.1 site-specific DNA-methyltransferase [Rossellomorea sp. AcN35-11]
MKLGQFELNNLYTEDNVEALKKIPPNSIDLTITSPPYDDLRDYNGYSLNLDELVPLLHRATKVGGVVVWVVADKTENGSESGSSFKQALKFMEVGFNLHDTMIYEKDSTCFPNPKRYHQIFEYMFVFSKGAPKTANLIKDRKNKHVGDFLKGGERTKDGQLIYRRRGSKIEEYGARNNIWKYNVGYMKSSKDKIAYEHPAIMPEKLAEDHILSWSNPGDVVLDVFSGSGTAAKMAYLNDRHYLGFDISEEYNKLAAKRIRRFQNQISLSI